MSVSHFPDSPFPKSNNKPDESLRRCLRIALRMAFERHVIESHAHEEVFTYMSSIPMIQTLRQRASSLAAAAMCACSLRSLCRS